MMVSNYGDIMKCLDNADEALYSAKGVGGNCVMTYT